jgi:hypothetical protein
MSFAISEFVQDAGWLAMLACKKWVQVGHIDSTSFKIKEGDYNLLFS